MMGRELYAGFSREREGSAVNHAATLGRQSNSHPFGANQLTSGATLPPRSLPGMRANPLVDGRITEMLLLLAVLEDAQSVKVLE
jgi:hypothetical protein